MTSMFHRFFPCSFHNPRCRDARWGCRCGKAKYAIPFVGPALAIADATKKKSSTSKSEVRANDLASQAQQRAVAEQSTQQQLYQPDPSQLEIQRFLQSQAGLTGHQLFGQISPEAQTLQSYIARQQGQTGEQLFGAISPQASAYQQNYQVPFESTLQPALDLAKQNVAAFANQRGIVGSGLELERLGRTGAELVIQEAGLRQQNALQNRTLAQDLISAQSGLQQGAQGAAAQLVGTQGNLQQNARNQNIDYNTLLREQQLKGVSAGLSAYQQGQNQRQQFDQASLEALNNRVQQSQQNVAGFGKLAADVAAIALAGPTGGASLYAIPAISSFGGGGGQAQTLFPGGGGYNNAQFMQALNQLGLGNTQSGALAQQRYMGAGFGQETGPSLSYLVNYPPTRKNIFGQDEPVTYR